METLAKTKDISEATSNDIDKMFSVEDEDGVFPDIPTLKVGGLSLPALSSL